MELRWTRTALDARLESLESRFSGQELIDAVVSFAETLTDEDKRLLEDALLDRAGKQVENDPGPSGWINASKRRRFSLPPRSRGPRPRDDDPERR